MFNNVSRLKHSSTINTFVTNKKKHFPQLFSSALKYPQTKMANLPKPTISTKLDIYVYKNKDVTICKGLLQTICLVILKRLIEFFD